MPNYKKFSNSNKGFSVYGAFKRSTPSVIYDEMIECKTYQDIVKIISWFTRNSEIISIKVVNNETEDFEELRVA